MANKGIKLGKRAPRVTIRCIDCGKSKETYASNLKWMNILSECLGEKGVYFYRCCKCYLKSVQGKPRPKEVCDKISKSKQGIVFSKEHIEKLSKARIGKKPWNDGISHSEETKAKLRAANIGKIIPPEVIEKMSLGMAKRLAQLPRKNARFKTGYFKSERFGKTFFYRSSFEEKALSIFEDLPFVKDVESETYIIPYMRDGIQHNYVVDFCTCLSSKKKVLVEIKPSYQLGNEITQLKLEAGNNYALEHGLGFCVLTEEELTNINSVETKLMEAIPSATVANLTKVDDIVRTT